MWQTPTTTPSVRLRLLAWLQHWRVVRALAEPMRALVSQYLASARRTNTAPDRALLLPIAGALGGIVAAEDLAEEADLEGDGDEGRNEDPGRR